MLRVNSNLNRRGHWQSWTTARVGLQAVLGHPIFIEFSSLLSSVVYYTKDNISSDKSYLRSLIC